MMSQAYSEFRSARESNDEDRLIRMWESLNLIEHPDLKSIALKEFWACDLDKLASLVKWGPNPDNDRQSLWFVDEEQWSLTLGSIPLATNATLDLQPLQKKWAFVPAWSVLPLWEEWAKANAPEHLHSIRRCLAVCSDPDSSEEEKTAARDAAWAAWAASEAARSAASDAASAARSAAWAASDASAAWAASDAARAASDAARAASDAANEDWCHKWTAYVLEHLKEKTRS